MRAIIAAIGLTLCVAYPEDLACDELAVGESIMGSTAVRSTARSVSFRDTSNNVVACDSTYQPGGTYKARISSTSDQYAIEISGGTFNSPEDNSDGNACGDGRVYDNNNRPLTAPTNGDDLVVRSAQRKMGTSRIDEDSAGLGGLGVVLIRHGENH